MYKIIGMLTVVVAPAPSAEFYVQTVDMKNMLPPRNASAKRKKISWGWIYFLITAALILFYLFNPAAKPDEVTWREMEKRMIGSHSIKKMEVINKERADIYIKESFAYTSYFKPVMKPRGSRTINKGPHYYLNIGSVESFERKMDEAQRNIPSAERIQITYINRNNWWEILLWVVPAVGVFALWRLLAKKTGEGASYNEFDFEKSKQRKYGSYHEKNLRRSLVPARRKAAEKHNCI